MLPEICHKRQAEFQEPDIRGSKKVLREFYNFGAPEQILYTSKPHIGTDNLIRIVKNIREEIIRLGGEVYFNEKAEDFEIEDGKIKIYNGNYDDYYNQKEMLKESLRAKYIEQVKRDKKISKEISKLKISFVV